jgi:magnesium chelatase family protein
VASVVHLGELGLDGRLRPMAGVLPAVLAASRAGASTVMVPYGNAEEAALVPGVTVLPIASLREAAIRHGGRFAPLEVEPWPAREVDDEEAVVPDLADVVGNDEAVHALELAAAGGHHVFFLGPPGAGKTMLAERLPGLLPDLDQEASLQATSIRSLSGRAVHGALVTRPPFEAPHHTATAAAVIGGGSGQIRPGAAVRAAHGVLFLDEAPEFPASVLDVLRQPLESGRIRIHRANASATFPGSFQLVLAANPCPCGQYGSPEGTCTCPPQARRRYLGRISGPLMDRIDIRLTLRRITSAQLRMSQGAGRTSTAAVRARVETARARAKERLTGTPWTTNGQVPGSWLRQQVRRLAPGTTRALDTALERGDITMRGYDRALRVAWTASDVAGTERPDADDIGMALYLRKGIA